MSLSSIATDGYLQGGAVSCVGSEGFLCGAIIVPEAEETYSGGYFDFEALRLPRRRFEAETEEEREAKPVLEDINEQLQTPGVETRTDLEIVLRMRLRLQGIRYQELYMEWLEQGLEQKKAAIKRKRRNKAITLLLLQ